MRPRRAKTISTRQRQSAFYESRPLKLTGSGGYADAEERAFWAYNTGRAQGRADELDRSITRGLIGVGVIGVGAVIIHKITGSK